MTNDQYQDLERERRRREESDAAFRKGMDDLQDFRRNRAADGNPVRAMALPGAPEPGRRQMSGGRSLTCEAKT